MIAPLAGLLLFVLVLLWARYETNRYRNHPTQRARRYYRARRGF
jgi:hypothetical protein